MLDRSVNVCEGWGILEWEIASRYCSRRKPLSNTLTYKSTIIPLFAFLNGMKEPRISSSLAVAGLGLLQNSIFFTSYRPFGILQRLGVASVLSTSSHGSVVTPLVSVALWNLASIYLAENPKLPYDTPGGTGQTKIDRAVAGRDHMFNPDYDPDGIMATVMTSVSMWIGNWCARNIKSKNESFVTGVSLFSMGYMFSYAFPQKLPFSETFWTLSFTLGTSGLSLMKWTIADGLSQVLCNYTIGNYLLRIMECMGSHTVEIYLVSSLTDQSGITDKVQSLSEGWKGIGLAIAFKSSITLLSAWLLHRLSQQSFI